MKINITRDHLNIIIPLVRNLRISLDTVDSFEGVEHQVLENKKKELDDLIFRLYDFED